MGMSKRYSALIAAALLVTVGGAGGAIAASDDDTRPSVGYERIPEVQPDAQAALAVLTTKRTASDGMPRQVAERMAADAPFGMNPALSRLAIGNATNSVYVIPANRHVCASLTVGEGANLICPSTDDVASGKAGAATVTIETGGIAVYGLVPDGVESVTVRTAGATSRLATERNAYYTVVPRGTVLHTVGYDGPSGPVEFPVSDPAAVFEEGR
jgi:hypothetical protein